MELANCCSPAPAFFPSAACAVARGLRCAGLCVVLQRHISFHSPALLLILFCLLKPLFHRFFTWLFFYSSRLSVGFLSSKRASLKLQADWLPPLCSWGALCLSPLILLYYVKISVHKSSLLDHKFLAGRDYILHSFVCLAPDPVPNKQEVCIQYVP